MLFIAFFSLLLCSIGYRMLLRSHMENWLGRQEVYAILFEDYPKDKGRLISEHLAAYQDGGEEALARKHEEMNLSLMGDYVRHYIARTPAETIRTWVVSETWLLSALYQKNQLLCQQYIRRSSRAEEVWATVGSDIFLPSIRAIPALIIQAHDAPEMLTDADKKRAMQLNAWMLKNLKAAGANVHTDGNAMLPCDTVYREFYMLTQLSPKDAALVVKLLYSDDHLQGSRLSPENSPPLMRLF